MKQNKQVKKENNSEYNKIKNTILIEKIAIGVLSVICVTTLLILILNSNGVFLSSKSNINNCTFFGKLEQGAEYINGDYTYRYMQEISDRYIVFNEGEKWDNMNTLGWGVSLTDKNSTKPITSKLCTYINNKPIVSMQGMFHHSVSEQIDFSGFNTSNVTNMSYMFYDSIISNLDLSSFDTSNVTNMRWMFAESISDSINLSSFDTSKVIDMHNMFGKISVTTLDISNFNTTNVKDMSMMFSMTNIPTLDLSSFDTTNVTNMNNVFKYNKINTCYARTQKDIDNFKNGLETDNKINFIVK